MRASLLLVLLYVACDCEDDRVARIDPSGRCAGTALALASAANELNAAGRLDVAAAALRCVLSACFPGRTPAWAGHGVRAEGCPDEAGLHNDLGAVLQQMWQLDDAERHFRFAVELRPSYTTAMNNLGVTLSSLDDGRSAEAARWYAAALRVLRAQDDAPSASLDDERRRRGTTTALFNAANALRDAGDVSGAVELLVDGLDLPPLLEAADFAAGEEEDGPPSMAVEHGFEFAPLAALFALLERRPWRHAAAAAALERQHAAVFALARSKARARGGRAAASRNETLLDAAARLQRSLIEPTNSLVVMLEALGRLPRDLGGLYTAIGGIEPPPAVSMGDAASNDERGDADACDAQRGGRLHLVMQYFLPASPERRRELDFALGASLRSRRLSHVHVLTEQAIDLRHIVDASRGGDATSAERCWPRLVTRVLGRRLSFGDAFAYAAEALAGDIVVVANADVFLEDLTLARLGVTTTSDFEDGVSMDGHVFALTRWDWHCELFPDGEAAEERGLAAVLRATDEPAARARCARFVPRVDSQDAWLFRAPLVPRLTTSLLTEADASATEAAPRTGAAWLAGAVNFSLGLPRADQRLAQVRNSAPRDKSRVGSRDRRRARAASARRGHHRDLTEPGTCELSRAERRRRRAGAHREGGDWVLERDAGPRGHRDGLAHRPMAFRVGVRTEALLPPTRPAMERAAP